MQTKHLLTAVLLSLVLPMAALRGLLPYAHAHGVVDQSNVQPVNDNIDLVGSLVPVAVFQSFTPTTSDLVAVDLDLSNNGVDPVTLPVTIPDPASLFGGTPIGETSVTLSPGDTGFKHIDFPSVIPITPGTVLSIQVGSAPMSTPAGTVFWRGNSAETYSMGGVIVLNLCAGCDGVFLIGHDRNFRTYHSGTTQPCPRFVAASSSTDFGLSRSRLCTRITTTVSSFQGQLCTIVPGVPPEIPPCCPGPDNNPKPCDEPTTFVHEIRNIGGFGTEITNSTVTFHGTLQDTARPGLVQLNVVTANATLSVTIIARPQPIVKIDVKPGNDRNSINVKSKGTIPAAVLANRGFEPAVVASVSFGKTGTEATAVPTVLSDVNGDGTLDLVVYFKTQDTGIKAGDTEATLTGVTIDGIRFKASDSIRAFLPGDVNGDLKVDILDLAIAAYAYGSSTGDARWVANADFDENSVINILDLAVVAYYYGTTS